MAGTQGVVISKKFCDSDYSVSSSVSLFCYRCLSSVQEEFGRAARPFLEQSLLSDRYKVPVAAGHGAGSVPLGRVTGSEPAGHPAASGEGFQLPVRGSRAQATCPGN